MRRPWVTIQMFPFPLSNRSWQERSFVREFSGSSLLFLADHTDPPPGHLKISGVILAIHRRISGTYVMLQGGTSFWNELSIRSQSFEDHGLKMRPKSNPRQFTTNQLRLLVRSPIIPINKRIECPGGTVLPHFKPTKWCSVFKWIHLSLYEKATP